jgi:echinoid protein
VYRWYKEGNTYPLEAETRSGNSRDSVTSAVITLTPSRGDDGAAYRCVVWNRAMPEGSKLEARVTLNVNCK